MFKDLLFENQFHFRCLYLYPCVLVFSLSMESGGEPATAPGVGAPETLVTIVLEELGLIRQELKHLPVLTAKVESLEKRTILGGEP